MHEWAELRHFRYLLAVLEKRGFRAAAEQLHTAQPNLSVQARQFQENASVRLFRKLRNGGIRPTESGVAFIALARLLLETVDEVLDALQAIERGDIRSVRLGWVPLANPNLFQDVCAAHKEILPACPVRPTHGDTLQLVEEVIAGTVDAAVVTLPLSHPDLFIEELRKDRLVVCLRRDDPLALKASLHPLDLQGNLAVLYHPQRHPDAHQRLVRLLADAGVRIDDYSCASHPLEVQGLVRDGHGFALVREGMNVQEELTTRPISGVDWTIDTAVIYHKVRHPKTIPLVVKKLRRQLHPDNHHLASNRVVIGGSIATRKHSSSPAKDDPIQLALLT